MHDPAMRWVVGDQAIAGSAASASHVTFQMAEVAVPRQMFGDILTLIARLRHRPLRHGRRCGRVYRAMRGKVCLSTGKAACFSVGPPSTR